MTLGLHASLHAAYSIVFQSIIDGALQRDNLRTALAGVPDTELLRYSGCFENTLSRATTQSLIANESLQIIREHVLAAKLRSEKQAPITTFFSS